MNAERLGAAQDLAALTVAAVIAEHRELTDALNAYVRFRSRHPGKPEQAAVEPSPAEQARAVALWRELIRRAIAGDAEAMAAVREGADDDLREPDGTLSKETLTYLLTQE